MMMRCSLARAAIAVLSVLAAASAQPQTVGLLLNDSAAFNGYTLFAPMHYKTTYLIDNNGELCHSWQSNWEPGRSVALLENGHLLHDCFQAPFVNQYFPGGGEGGRVEEYDWDGSMVWVFNYSDSMHLQHHEVKPLPNGNVIMIAYDRMLRDEALAAGRRPDRLPENELWPDHVIEVQKTGDTTGTIVWEWHVWDHLIQDYDSTKANYGVVAQHPELIDVNFGDARACWNHTNSINYNAALDQIVLSVRGNSEIWVIDHSTTTEQARGHTGGSGGKGGDLLYRWGNPQAYRAGNGADEKLFQQHDGGWIPDGCPGAGNMLIFNNGIGRGYSSIDEIVPPVDTLGHYYLPPGGHYGPEAAVWSYVASPPSSFYSSEISGAQRQPNGNTLVCAGIFGDFFEVEPDSEKVWHYINPVTDSGPMYQGDTVRDDPGRPGQKMNAVFKIARYAPDYPGLAGRNLDPQGPIERSRPGVQEMAEPAAPRPRLLGNRWGMLTFAGLPSSGSICIYTTLGALIKRHEFTSSDGSYLLSLAGDARSRPCSGVYFCQVTDNIGSVLLSGKLFVIR
jgi:hypothetical protein